MVPLAGFLSIAYALNVNRTDDTGQPLGNRPSGGRRRLEASSLGNPLFTLADVKCVARTGSGKSSLAFDTIYAERQRRYVETFSPYAQQFLDRMDRPRVEQIEGIPPAIAID
jgi:excinuclease ABC subunit A